MQREAQSRTSILSVAIGGIATKILQRYPFGQS